VFSGGELLAADVLGGAALVLGGALWVTGAVV
jgi:hypothetical protein